MDEQSLVLATAGVILVYFLAQVARRAFDPFAPVWLFLVGYAQVYVIQALSYHEWALEVRGKDLVAAANFRALWATRLVPGRLPSRGSAADRPCTTPAAARMVDRCHCHARPSVDCSGDLFCAGVVIRGEITGGGDDFGRGSTAQVVPVRDDGRGDHADRHGSDPGRTPAAFFPAGLLVAASTLSSGCSTASARTR